MGAQGTVFLCQHVLDDQPLGLYAVKKVAVGTSHAYLAQILREIRLLQGLRHENIGRSTSLSLALVRTSCSDSLETSPVPSRLDRDGALLLVRTADSRSSVGPLSAHSPFKSGLIYQLHIFTVS